MKNLSSFVGYMVENNSVAFPQQMCIPHQFRV